MDGFRAFEPEDDADIGDWMGGRQYQVRLRPAADVVGRDVWNEGLLAGSRFDAATPDDVIRLGMASLSGPSPDGDSGNSISPVDSAQTTERVNDRADPITANEPLVRPPAFGFATARPGDSISKLLGTSDPGAIGRFLRLNGFDGRSSRIAVGQTYAVPDGFDDASEDEIAAGKQVLGQDNQRLAAVRADRARRQSADAAWQANFQAGRNVWTGEPVAWPTGPSKVPQDPEPPTWWDRSTLGRGLAKTAGYAEGLGHGELRGFYHMGQDALGVGMLAARLANPVDALVSPPGQSAADQVLGAAANLGRASLEAATHPARTVGEAGAWLHDQNVALNPFATPLPLTAKEAFDSGLKVGANDGELLTNVLVPGGEASRAFRGFEVVSKEAEMARLMEQGFSEAQADRLSEPYNGVGSHFLPQRSARRLGLPDWLATNPFTLLKPEGIRQAQMYELHARVDPYFNVARIPKRYDGGIWHGPRLGIETYGPLGRVLYGAPPATKGLAGGALGAVGGAAFDNFGGDSVQ